MAGISPVGCVEEIGKCILTPCLWPPMKRRIDYWWCFDNNIKDLRDGVRDLDREIHDLKQKIEAARLRTEILRPGVQEWLNDASQKLVEARRILQDNINPKAWNLISRYSMGQRAKKAAEEIAELRNGGKFDAISDPAPPPAMGSISHISTMDFDSRKRIEEEIIKSLKKSSVGMIGICGMGGVGKTTMAQRIRERVMDEKLFDEVVMVVVSQPIDMPKIQKEVAELLGLKFDVEGMSARADKLRKRLMDTKSKIIVFDDVWESLKFEDLGIPFESDFERCKVLMTSRSRDTYKGIKNKKVFELKILEEEEAWILFKEKAGECVEDSALLSVAKHVAAECKCLPIALVTVATALQNETNKYIWKHSLSQLRQSNPTDLKEVLVHVYKPLKLSYDYLASDSQKELFLLCCLFPEDYDIPIEQLTLYSMGLRLFDGISSIEEARNRAHALVEKLKSRFLLIDSWNELHVRMHDVVRDVAIYIGSKEKNGFLKSLNKTSIESSSDVNCSWMSVDISNERIEIPVALRFPKLRLLMLLKSSYEEFSDIYFEGMEDLIVLRFPSTRIGSLPPTLGLLQNLRTLCLFCCEVENISVIGELTSLEVFSCNGCNNIKQLPAEIGRLNCLRLLELNECHKLQRIPFGILSSLVQLEELKMIGSFDGWEAEENGTEMRNASLTELECLPKLTCLEIEISDWNSAAQEIRLSPKLVKYKIYITSKNYRFEETDYEKVMKLNLPCEIGAVGKWIRLLLRNSESVFLRGDGSNNFNLEECQDLRNLRVWNCSMLKKLVKTKDCKSGKVFPLLESLRLEALENLEEICDGKIILNQNVSLCHLKSVVITSCSNLRTLFSVSMAQASLSQLEVLEIQWCEKMEQVFWNDITDDTDACIEFPKLKKLKLEDLPNLTAFCQGVESIKFPNLTDLEIENLEEIFDGTILLNQNVSLCNLKSIQIRLCSNLRHLFSVSMARRCLLQLEVLQIICCDVMEQVFWNEIADDTDSFIEFPKLKTLRLEDLPNLTAFCPGVESIKFPNLTDLRIENLEEILDSTILLNQNVSLCNLKSVVITSCFNLRTLFVGASLLQLEVLEIGWCDQMEQVFWNDITDNTEDCIEFPKLKTLMLEYLPNLTAFCQGIETTKFPNLTDLTIGYLPKLNRLSPLNSETPHHDRTCFNFLCNQKVEIGGLHVLRVFDFGDNIKNIWCDQIPINFFDNLQDLSIYNLNGIRSLMSYSIAKNLMSLCELHISNCEEMVEVIESNDDDKEVLVDKCFFPALKVLKIRSLPKLRRFWQWNQALELPLLQYVILSQCQVMETFSLGFLNTPNIELIDIGHRLRFDQKDLNHVIRQHWTLS